MAVHRATRDRIDAATGSLGPGPWTFHQLVGLGWSPKQLERAVAGGGLARLRRGIYAAALARPLPAPLDFRIAHLRAVMSCLPDRAVVSHSSAAWLHGQWDPCRPSAQLHVTIPGQSERTDLGLTVHGSRLPEELVTERSGLRVTTVARTAVDLARGLDLPQALVAVDGAWRLSIEGRLPAASWRLRERTVPPPLLATVRGELDAAYGSVLSWPGTRIVRSALDLGDPASESAFESWSRGWMAATGLPRPVLNAEVWGSSGQQYFGDFVWRSRRVIGEADGMAKYGAGTASVRRFLNAQAERQDDLESAGWTVVRWATGTPGRTIVARLGRALYL
jgi:hypothetical protein